MLRSVITLVAVASCAVASPAMACSVGAVSLTEVRKSSDVIATGTVHVLKETEEKKGDTTETTGLIQLRDPKILKNRTGPLGPLRFRTKLIATDDGCIFGQWPPNEGDLVTVYLARSSGPAPRLVLIHVEVLEQAPEEDEDQDETRTRTE